MTKALPFTELGIERAIRGARRGGIEVEAVTVHADGSVTLHKVAPPVAPGQNAGAPDPWAFKA